MKVPVKVVPYESYDGWVRRGPTDGICGSASPRLAPLRPPLRAPSTRRLDPVPSFYLELVQGTIIRVKRVIGSGGLQSSAGLDKVSHEIHVMSYQSRVGTVASTNRILYSSPGIKEP